MHFGLFLARRCYFCFLARSPNTTGIRPSSNSAPEQERRFWPERLCSRCALDSLQPFPGVPGSRCARAAGAVLRAAGRGLQSTRTERGTEQIQADPGAEPNETYGPPTNYRLAVPPILSRARLATLAGPTRTGTNRWKETERLQQSIRGALRKRACSCRSPYRSYPAWFHLAG